MVFISLHWKNESSMETGALQNLFMAEFPFPVLSRWQMLKKCLRNEVTNDEKMNSSVFSAPQTGKDAMQDLPWKWLNKVLNSENTALCNSSPDGFEQPKFKYMYVLNKRVYVCVCVCVTQVWGIWPHSTMSNGLTGQTELTHFKLVLYLRIVTLATSLKSILLEYSTPTLNEQWQYDC